VLETVENSISGIIGDGIIPVKGALVSAQIFDDAVQEPLDVVIETSTVSNADGNYKLFLPPDTYNVVATAEGYQFGCREVEAQFFEDYTAHFTLAAVEEVITLGGTVSGLASPEDSAVLSVRQKMDCGAGVDVTVEVASLPVADGGTYSFTLPVGPAYILVASAFDETNETTQTQVFDDLSNDIEVNIVFNL
jgi:hypothetical protein